METRTRRHCHPRLKTTSSSLEFGRRNIGIQSWNIRQHLTDSFDLTWLKFLLTGMIAYRVLLRALPLAGDRQRLRRDPHRYLAMIVGCEDDSWKRYV